MHQTGYDTLYEMHIHDVWKHKFLPIWCRMYFSFQGKPFLKVDFLQDQAHAN